MAFANTVTGVPKMSANTSFFDKFPTINYDINNTVTYMKGPHEVLTNIFFRLGFIKNIINNTSAYYVYSIQDSDTPEILAENVYGDRGAGWIIIYANKIFDPQFDWPLHYDAFQKMIIDKYGSLEWASTNNHHYEMVITRTNEFAKTTQTTTFVIDEKRLSNNTPDQPYPYFTPPGEIPLTQEVNTYDVDGKTVVETISSQPVSYYDYEVKINDDKRVIKIIKPEYYVEIITEFKNLTDLKINLPSYLRGFA